MISIWISGNMPRIINLLKHFPPLFLEDMQPLGLKENRLLTQYYTAHLPERFTVMVCVQGEKDVVGLPPGSFLTLCDSALCTLPAGWMKDRVSNSLPRNVILIKIVSGTSECCRVILMKRRSSNAAALDSFAKSSSEMISYGENSLINFNFQYLCLPA